MGGTKIFVLQMKDVIRTAVFAALGLVLVILLVVLFIPKDTQSQAEPSALYIPGVYSAPIVLNGQPVDVRVSVSENEITGIEMDDMADIQAAFYPLFEPALHDLEAEVLLYQSADIVPVTDYPVTASILRDAVAAALELAHVG